MYNFAYHRPKSVADAVAAFKKAADGKYIAFDAAGNKKAEAALRASKKKTDLQVAVTGDVSGDNMKVATLALN